MDDIDDVDDDDDDEQSGHSIQLRLLLINMVHGPPRLNLNTEGLPATASQLKSYFQPLVLQILYILYTIHP